MTLKTQQISQQNPLVGPIDSNNSFFVIDQLDPVSGLWLTYKVNATQLSQLLSLSSGGVFTVKTVLSPAQILSLYTTPQVLVPAAGAGLIIQPLNFIAYMAFATAAYDANTELIGYSAGSPSAFHFDNSSGSILGATGNFLQSGIQSLSASIALSSLENQNLLLSVKNGNPSTGGGTLTVYTSFIVIKA